MKISKQKLKKLKEILYSDYGVILEDASVSILADKLLRMTLLTKRHCFARFLKEIS
jgi:hypothetical protein